MKNPPTLYLLAWLACAALLTSVSCSDDDYIVGDAKITPTDAKLDGATVTTDGKPNGLPANYKPYGCKVPGKSCNAHDACAFNPVCGADLKCWPEYLMNCDDGLSCTDDKCMGLGLCKNTPQAGFCKVMYKTGVDDGGVPITEPKCVAVGTRKPDDPCMGCSPTTSDAGASNNTKWMPVSGGSCDDGDKCTKSDTCISGVCKGTSFRQLCADTYGCTDDLCDGVGGCLGNTLKAGWCIIDKTCYKDGGKKPDGSCYECDSKKSTSGWTAISNTCNIDSKCYKKGDLNIYKCAQCDPGYSTSSWTVVGSSHCLISNVCKKTGDLDSIKCAQCDPTKNKYGWTPLAGVCKIYDKCYNKAAKHPLGCAECDPTASGTAWTVKGSYCLINDKCFNPGAKDSIGCGTCDPTKNRYGWTPIAGLCKISGTCYKKGDLHPGKCAACDPSVSSTSWTISSSTNQCLINGTCKSPGDKDLSGCSQCDPTTDKYKWTSLTGVCKIDGQCFKQGDKHTGGCAACDANTSKTSWTPSTGKCVIGGKCYNSGAKDSTGCGVCTPSSSQTSWTSSSCIVGPSKCVSKGAKEPGGCGVCEPSKNTGGWTPGNGCKAVHAWSYKFGGSSSDYGYGVGTDSDGNVYVAGYFYSSINLGGTTYSSKGVYDVFLVSYTPGGVFRWGKTFGSTSYDYLYDLAVDNAGNVYITGYHSTTINFGGSTLSTNGSYDIFLASFDSSGKHRWSKNFGGTSSDYGYGLATDASGNVYLTGYFYVSANFGGGTLTSKGSYDIFVASYDTSGKHRWSKAFGNTSGDYGYGIAVDGSGNVYVTGYFYNSVNFGGSTISSNGSGDMFLVSFTPSGVHRWSKGFGGTSSDYGYDVATDAAGNVYVTGYFYYNIKFGTATLTSLGSYDAYVASFTSGGSHRWSKSFGSTSSDYGYGIDLDSKGNVYVTGMFYLSMDLGNGVKLTSNGSYDAYVASFDTTGNARWGRAFGSTSSDYGRAIALDPDDNVLAAGYFYYTVDFGGGSLTASSTDAYLVKLEQ